MYKKGRVNSNSRIISTDEDPSLRIESSSIINLRGVSTKLNKYNVVLINILTDFPVSFADHGLSLPPPFQCWVLSGRFFVLHSLPIFDTNIEQEARGTCYICCVINFHNVYHSFWQKLSSMYSIFIQIISPVNVYHTYTLYFV